MHNAAYISSITYLPTTRLSFSIVPTLSMLRTELECFDIYWQQVDAVSISRGEIILSVAPPAAIYSLPPLTCPASLQTALLSHALNTLCTSFPMVVSGLDLR